jgi:hypothetical protein
VVVLSPRVTKVARGTVCTPVWTFQLTRGLSKNIVLLYTLVYTLLECTLIHIGVYVPGVFLETGDTLGAGRLSFEICYPILSRSTVKVSQIVLRLVSKPISGFQVPKYLKFPQVYSNLTQTRSTV